MCQCANWLRCLINVPIGCAFYSLLISGNKIYKKKDAASLHQVAASFLKY